MHQFRFRPTIVSAIMFLGVIALYAVGTGNIEVATGCTGGIIALGMKLLERGGNGGG